MMLRIGGIVNDSIVDGPGIRLTLFTQGCTHACEGCHNHSLQSFAGGSLISADDVLDLIKRNPLLDGVTFSGGEPFQQAEACSEIAKGVKNRGLHVMAYTGYTWEELQNGILLESGLPGWKDLLVHLDLLVDGRFEISKRNLMLRFRGSENQRIIDVQRSLSAGSAVESIASAIQGK
jgi:anaerobic ribonucleoside-triphosphate reductase activating protein